MYYIFNIISYALHALYNFIEQRTMLKKSQNLPVKGLYEIDISLCF